MNIEKLEFPIKYPRPCYIWKTDIDNYHDVNLKILDTISTHRSKNPKGYTDFINLNVWQTSWNMENEPGFDVLSKLSLKFCEKISKEHFNFHQFQGKIIDCWTNVYNYNSGCRIHQHFPATFSLVYYVDVPENSGCITFPDLEIKINPYPGLLLCFRGDTWHGVEINQTHKDRVIVAFNIMYN